MDPENKTYYGLATTTNSEGDMNSSELVVERKQVNVWHPLTKGDHVTPNSFGFQVFRGRGYPAHDYQRYTSQGQVRWINTTSDSFSGSGYGYSPYGELDWSLTDDQALGSLLDQLKSGPNVSVDVAESGQTLRMLKNAFNVRKQMKEVVEQAVKGKAFRRRSRGQNRLDYVTSKWLEARYGWLPLIHSTYDILRECAKRVDTSLFVVRGRSSRSDADKVSTGSGTYWDPRRTTDFSLHFRTEIQAQFRLPTTTQIYNWTTLNPALIAWELMPLSFVADWFVNVGETMALWENHLIFANKFVRGYRTRSFREDLSFTYTGLTTGPIPYWPNTNTIYDGVVFHRDKFYGYSEMRLYKNREVLDSLPAPTGGPRVNVNLNSKRLLDAAALIHMFTKDKGRKHGF